MARFRIQSRLFPDRDVPGGRTLGRVNTTEGLPTSPTRSWMGTGPKSKAARPYDDDATSTANARANCPRCSIRIRGDGCGCGCGRYYRHHETHGGATMRQKKVIVAVAVDGGVDNQASAIGLGLDVASGAAPRVHSKDKGGLSQQPPGDNKRPWRDGGKNHHCLFGTKRLCVQRAPFPGRCLRRPRRGISPRCLSPGSEPTQSSAVVKYCARACRARAPSPRQGAGDGAARDRQRAR